MTNTKSEKKKLSCRKKLEWDKVNRDINIFTSIENIDKFVRFTCDSTQRTELIMKFWSYIYNICTTPSDLGTKPPTKVYNLMKEIYNTRLNYYEDIHNNHYDKHNIQLTLEHKKYIMWSFHQYMRRLFTKGFAYLKHYSDLQQVPKTLGELFYNKYNTNKQDVRYIKKDWIKLYKAQQRLQLSKINYHIPYDLFTNIVNRINNNHISHRLLFRTINIEIEDYKSQRTYIMR